ncbi:heat shock 70 kDa protein 12A isoform X2 [Lingula anatina]|uniref:Heat shock 70 kDa protein 12A isoform X2 n=1 Tax=Lingula anatina TaxID=7574 RepID=A0A1S3JTB3_LINAN|nr:heat shock 70 kDa protein 12A isoform X2 [Lingula anatina]|eukprot:XP_013413356.1 heat shock 70 kDa protein 12A isoform X2 [Lingula anatina]
MAFTGSYEVSQVSDSGDVSDQGTFRPLKELVEESLLARGQAGKASQSNGVFTDQLLDSLEESCVDDDDTGRVGLDLTVTSALDPIANGSTEPVEVEHPVVGDLNATGSMAESATPTENVTTTTTEDAEGNKVTTVTKTVVEDGGMKTVKTVTTGRGDENAGEMKTVKTTTTVTHGSGPVKEESVQVKRVQCVAVRVVKADASGSVIEDEIEPVCLHRKPVINMDSLHQEGVDPMEEMQCMKEMETRGVDGAEGLEDSCTAPLSTPERSVTPVSCEDSGVANESASSPTTTEDPPSREQTPVKEEPIQPTQKKKQQVEIIIVDGDEVHDENRPRLSPVSPVLSSPGSQASTDGSRPSSGVDFIEGRYHNSFDVPNSPLSPSTANKPMTPNSAKINADVHHPHNLESAIQAHDRMSVDSGTGSERVRHQGHFVVVAIDFGTTYSGYAFSFTRDPDSIHMMRKWEGGDAGVINQKTPTCLLLSPEGKFHSFGYSARNFFHDLHPQEAKRWMYFDKFKMMLHHNAELNQSTMLKASNGKSVRALTIFAYALKFFKEHALQELSDQSATTFLNEDVRWVITVPAIWKSPAKQFMREAAYEAGISSPEYADQLLIALEPEAASIYCRKLRMHQLTPEVPPEKRPLSIRQEEPPPLNTDPVADGFQHDSYYYKTCRPNLPLEHDEEVEAIIRGTRYMVVDCGGGTVDITVHEMDLHGGGLKELYKATGGPHGSIGVDMEFEKLLADIFGADYLQAFKLKRPAGYVDLTIAFESRKRAANPFRGNHLNVSLPFSFIDYYKKYKGNQVENAIRKYGDKEIRWSTQGFLRLSPEAMRRLFFPTLERIKQAVGDVLNHPNVKDVKYLFLVGGFAESPMLQQDIRREFGHLLKVIIPQEVGLTILKGAVLFGLDPTVVQVRRSRMVYGIGVLNRFQPGKHPKSKKITKDGADWCTDVFDKFVDIDQAVALGDSALRSYTPAKAGQKVSIINIYCSDRPDVKFITDKSVKKCGQLVLDLSDDNYQDLPKRRELQTRMQFGDTEIKVSALDVATGKCVRASIDFLNK